MEPFLTIITRTCRRPGMLARCKASVEAQTDRDFEHVLLADDVGRGVPWANARLYAEQERIRGRYVYVLDDDVVLADPYFVSDMHAIARAYAPDVIMVRADLLQFGILPDWLVWKQTPILGRIDMACFCVRADVWRAHVGVFEEPRYEADFVFIDAIFKDRPRVYWHDKLTARAQAISRGRMATPAHFMCWTWIVEHTPITDVKRALYVGANRCAPPMYAAEIVAAGVQLDLLEIWDGNLEYYRANPGPFTNITQGDVRASELGRYDAIVWWHGPEHIDRADLANTVARLRRAAPLVVMGCPWGLYPQGTTDGNVNETHRATLYPADFEALGLETFTVGEDGDGHIVAVGRETA